MAMNLQGDFEGLFLTSILQLLCNDQKTGVLRVSSGNNECKVFFEEGTIVHASGSQKESRLGYILRRDGVISAEQLQKCLTLGREQKVSLGKIVVDKGYISESTLKKYSTKQVEDILYSLLLWKKGQFEYKDIKLNLDGMVVTQLNPMKLILEASRRIDEMSVLNTVITSDQLVFRMSGNVQNKDEIKLNANEWRILSLIDGNRTIRQIVTKSGYDEFAVYKIFFSLNSYGLIEQTEEVQLGDPAEGNQKYSAIITVYNDILVAVSKNVEDELGERGAAIFNEVKVELDDSQAMLLEYYHPENHININVKSIVDEMASAIAKGAVEEDVQDILMKGFYQYTTAVLYKIKEILGVKPLEGILRELENIIGYVKKYHPESREKSKIVNDIGAILNGIQSNGKKGGKKGGKSKKGFFSLFG